MISPTALESCTRNYKNVKYLLVFIISDIPSHNDRHEIHKHPPPCPDSGLDRVADPKISLNATKQLDIPIFLILYLMARVRYMEVTMEKLAMVIMAMKMWERNFKCT